MLCLLKMDKEFYNRDPETVARELLGKILVRKIGSVEKRGRIVETEAYFDDRDPASRACQNGDLRETMKMDAGTILVYGVHSQWLVNFVTGKEGEAAAVLIRAVEPLNFDGRGNGPGLLTRSLDIDKGFHKHNVIGHDEVMVVGDSGKDGGQEVVESFRIGVKRDLPKKLRFYIKGNKHISKK